MFLMLFSISGYSQQGAIEECRTYLEKSGLSPENYVISKFEQYDYVFLGEYHRNKQDVDFVTLLIPDLYKKVKFVRVSSDFYDEYNLIKLKEFLKCMGWSDEDLQAINRETAVELLTETPESHFENLVK